MLRRFMPHFAGERRDRHTFTQPTGYSCRCVLR
jgi:hypothetical protein